MTVSQRLGFACAVGVLVTTLTACGNDDGIDVRDDGPTRAPATTSPPIA